MVEPGAGPLAGPARPAWTVTLLGEVSKPVRVDHLILGLLHIDDGFDWVVRGSTMRMRGIVD